MSVEAGRGTLEEVLAEGDGMLRLEPAWVARDFVPPGRRLGLPEEAYDVGERGYICERWLASTTKADNLVGPADEGLSYIAHDGGGRLSLREAVRGWAGWRRSSTTVPGFPFTSTCGSITLRWSDGIPRTRPTTSPQALTWARIRRPSSGCIPGSHRHGPTTCCFPISRRGTAMRSLSTPGDISRWPARGSTSRRECCTSRSEERRVGKE